MRSPRSSRLAIVDGWRTVAAFGVIWVHAWTHTGNPSLLLHLGSYSTNVERWFVLLGNGVDLFFVISGFCISLTTTKNPICRLSDYGQFIAHRWWRLTPAFYFVCLVTGIAVMATGGFVTLSEILAHLTWTFEWWPGTHSLAPAFWSLQIEWQFYLTVPLLLALAKPKRQRWLLLVALLVISFAWRGWSHSTPDGIAGAGSQHLPEYLAAFIWGIIVADFWRSQPAWFTRIKGWPFLILGLSLAYFGRGLSSTEVFTTLRNFGVVAKTASHPFMTLGFAVMLAATLNGVRGLSAFLSTAPLQWAGKNSYSLYLWHWWPCLWIGHWVINFAGPTIGAHYTTLALTLMVCCPLAWLTYRYCEKPYFNRKPKTNLA